MVVDADVLIRNVDYAVRKGYKPALLGRASPGYSIWTGIALFATPCVMEEAIRHLRDIADRRGDVEGVRLVWNDVIVPNVRVVPVPPEAMMDQRVAAVATLHAADAPTAALALLLAPSVLVTDNRRDFRPLGLPDTKTDAVAVDVYTLGEMGISVNGVELAARAVGYAGVSGAKKLASTIGREAALALGLVAVGLLVAYLRSERGRSIRERVATIAKEVGPPLMAELERMMAAGERVSEFALGSPLDASDRSPVALVARHLAVDQPRAETSEVLSFMAQHGFRWEPRDAECRNARAWLASYDCFREVAYGLWSLGYHLGPMEALPGSDVQAPP